jgi:hypothetical protein
VKQAQAALAEMLNLTDVELARIDHTTTKKPLGPPTARTNQHTEP